MLMQPIAQPFSGLDLTLQMPGSAITPAATTVDLASLLLVLWAAGFAAILIRWLVRWSKLRELLREAVDLKFAAPIAVKSSSSRIEPGLVGIFQPTILLPEGIEEQLSPAEMDTIVAHELCHWRRRDNLLAAIHMLVEVLFWFFPLVWWLGARLNAERERACDESVLAAGGDPAIYADSILKVCRLYLQSPLACAAGVSGAGLKQRMDVIMENRFLVRLNVLKKSLLATCAATAIVAPLSLGLLTAPPAQSAAAAQTADAPHPGTEAALRRQIDGWESKQPVLEGLSPSMIMLTKQQQATIQIMIDGWGSLKSITFKENGPGGGDVYLVEFEHGSSVWTVQPLQGGKIAGMGFQAVEKRTDNGPSPGVEAAVRRNYEGLLKGAPAYDIMGQGLIAATNQQLADLELDAKNLGTLKTLTFTKINAQGWDVYAATFDKGISSWRVRPLTDGKLSGILWSDVHVPGAPAHPGTEASLRRYIDSLEKGQPNYDDMAPALAAIVKLQLPELLASIRTWGALESIAFKGGGTRGMDVYEVTFEHGRVEWSVAPLTSDGKVERRGFRPLS
jgi:beta-lactamase regulating signal transducer with metallopeptidase domain